MDRIGADSDAEDGDFSALFDFLPIGVYRSRPDGTWLRVNLALARLNGYETPAEYIGAVADIATECYVRPTDRAEFRARLESEGQFSGFEVEILRHRTGERIWARVSARVVRSVEGAVRFYEGTVEDITAAIQSRQALERSEQTLRQLAERLPGAVYRLRTRGDSLHRIDYMSEGIAELMGVTPEQCLADPETTPRLRHPDDQAWVDKVLRRCNVSGEPVDIEYRIVLPDGRLKWVHQVSSVAWPDGDAVVRVGMVLDTTARHTAEVAHWRSTLQLQQMVDLLPGAVFRVEIDDDGSSRYSHVSAAVRPLFGVNPEAALADADALLHQTHPDDDAWVRAEVFAALAERRPVSIEFRIRTPAGRDKWVHLLSQPAIDPGSGRDGRVGMLFDISARRAAEQALRENSLIWQRALESTGDGAWDLNLAEDRLEVSAGLKALYGYRVDEPVSGEAWLKTLIHPDDLAATLAARNAHLCGEVPVYINERRMRHRSGRWLHILSRGMVLARDAHGRALRMIGTHTDITGQREAEALRLERDAAAAADRAKTEFLGTVSHELRTPLNAVLGFSQLLEHDGLATARQAGWVQQIIASGHHLLALMDDILDLSSVQSGRLRLMPEPVTLASGVDQSWAMLEGTAQAQQVLRLDEATTAGALAGRAVWADRRRLLQLLNNLLSNAIKYNRMGGSVRIAARPETLPDGRSAFALDIADSGVGMSPDQIGRLFRPFERLGAQHGSVPGTGLGLALSRSLAEAMGGTLVATSEPGVGSCFTLTLPAAPPATAGA
ncbi:MAG: PAS domain-containing protein [Rubrivivax sp.]|nr:PAS domain-containing protein [Rubrivivax sp.]